MHWTQFLWVGLGGALGASGRFWLSAWLNDLNRTQFPLGTFAVNAIGSFLFGVFFVVVLSGTNLKEPLRLLVLVGFLGAFTTFSTFSFETVRLLQEQQVMMAAVNVVANCLVCFAGVWLGSVLARALF
ncbi:fluoride efflux transporter CrcB [Ketobacter sp.]|uniref:fluoride efflux transporter CrcB n=1 Tax=Ketobacter sp. TaxID=2083498 RepID=UPI000F194302|nr:fluoride efflux transporter CrcB [Ketobacter sp.]RLT97376.1 MAG: fluoride efflux transporter CrcB [Ketobacter sp.]